MINLPETAAEMGSVLASETLAACRQLVHQQGPQECVIIGGLPAHLCLAPDQPYAGDIDVCCRTQRTVMKLVEALRTRFPGRVGKLDQDERGPVTRMHVAGVGIDLRAADPVVDEAGPSDDFPFRVMQTFSDSTSMVYLCGDQIWRHPMFDATLIDRVIRCPAQGQHTSGNYIYRAMYKLLRYPQHRFRLDYVAGWKSERRPPKAAYEAAAQACEAIDWVAIFDSDSDFRSYLLEHDYLNPWSGFGGHGAAEALRSRVEAIKQRGVIP